MRARALLAAGAAAAAAAGSRADPPPVPASIVRIALGPEESEHQPFAIPTEPGNTVEVDLPWPLQDWAGRGFTPDAERYAGDFAIEASRGSSRIFVTPLAQEAHRVLHVVVGQPGAGARSLPLEFMPAPPTLAWRKVQFVSPGPEGPPRAAVSLSSAPPLSRLRQPSPASEVGLIRTLRLMLAATEDEARAVANANPGLEFAVLRTPPRNFGDFSLTCRFAVRDSATGALGVCVGVANLSRRRIFLDPMSWALRVADRVYPVRTVDCPPELEPGADVAAFLVLADGATSRLLPDNDFEPSVAMSGSANPRPVRRLGLEEGPAP